MRRLSLRHVADRAIKGFLSGLTKCTFSMEYSVVHVRSEQVEKTGKSWDCCKCCRGNGKAGETVLVIMRIAIGEVYLCVERTCYRVEIRREFSPEKLASLSTGYEKRTVYELISGQFARKICSAGC